MTVIVVANDVQWKELTESRPNIEWVRVDNLSDFNGFENAEAFFCLNDSVDPSKAALTTKPVFINAVVNTLHESKTPANVLRINGWPGFIGRKVWEIAGEVGESVNAVFKASGIKINKVADEPGFISARVIAMIVNEAYFALSENVSSKKEIDTAMKLGTNYPYGPFEWAGIIGESKILALLQKLFESDVRYQPAALLIEEAKNNS